jgi:hypothetical protein
VIFKHTKVDTLLGHVEERWELENGFRVTGSPFGVVISGVSPEFTELGDVREVISRMAWAYDAFQALKTKVELNLAGH